MHEPWFKQDPGLVIMNNTVLSENITQIRYFQKRNLTSDATYCKYNTATK
jgi:hypothetical protein